MLIIGLTGSIGMGKSTAAARFRALGIPVFDADAEVHRLYAGPLAARIEAAFPGTTANGAVDRAKLSQSLMKNPAGFKKLEQIVHPAVREEERRFLDTAKAAGAAIAVLEIPLLLEAKSDEQVDVVVVVSAGPEVQRGRVLERPGMTTEKLETLLARQMPDAEKRERADFVVDTSGSIAACNSQIDRIVATLQGREGTAINRVWKL